MPGGRRPSRLAAEVQTKAAGCRRGGARDDLPQSAFAAPRRPQQAQEFAALNAELDPGKRLQPRGEALADPMKLDDRRSRTLSVQRSSGQRRTPTFLFTNWGV